MKDKRNSLRKSTLPRLHYGNMLYKLLFFSSNMLHYNKLLIYVIPVQTLFRQGRIALQANGQILTLVWVFFFFCMKQKATRG